MKKRNTAGKIGEFAAHIQDAFDRLFSFTFEKMQSFGEAKPEKDDCKVKKAVRTVSRYIGDFGNAFYEKYTELKKRKNESDEDEEMKKNPPKKRNPGRKKPGVDSEIIS